MSVSKTEREANIDLALALMMIDLQEPYEWQEHDATMEKFAGVFHTTWDELVEQGLVVFTGHDCYQLTGAGWIGGLKISGYFDDPEFRKKAGRLSQALKDRVKGRHDFGYANRAEIANETGLSEFFIYDAIDSHLLRKLFNYTDAAWAEGDQMKNEIDIPPRFGLGIL